MGVVDIHYVPADFVGKLIDASLSDIGVDVVKTGISLLPILLSIGYLMCRVSDFLCGGMLASAEIIKVVAEALDRHHVTTLVVDPVREIAASF